MAFLQLQTYSAVLGITVSVNIILPERREGYDAGHPAVPRGGFPTLWLLHGLSDDHTAWMRQTSIERYAVERGVAVIMPAINRSFYTDMVAGPQYATFLRQELSHTLGAWLPLARDRARTFVAGLSMGGYGAFHWALSEPHRFAAAASLSGALDMVSRVGLAERENPDHFAELERAFGPAASVRGGPADLSALATRAAGSGVNLPRLLQICGTEDFLYADNLRFRDHASKLDLDLTYEQGPGAHTWSYWDAQIQRVLAWLPL